MRRSTLLVLVFVSLLISGCSTVCPLLEGSIAGALCAPEEPPTPE